MAKTNKNHGHSKNNKQILFVIVFCILGTATISVASAEQIPDIYDDFSDGKYQDRTGTDPWGRPLPEWTVEQGSIDASNDYIMAESFNSYHAILSTSTDITKGTWIFTYKYIEGTPSFTGNNYLLGVTTYYLNPSDGNILRFENPVDGHWWLDFLSNNGRVPHGGYIVNMVGSLIDKNLVGGNAWHEVVFIKDENGYIYTWLDGEFVRWSSDKTDDIPDSTKFVIDLYDFTDSQLQYPIIVDDVRIYKDQYIPPVNTIVYDSELDSIVIKGFGANLSKIAAAVNDPSVFSYDPSTNTGIAYRDITVTRGSELKIENGTLQMDSSYDGERKIKYYTDAIFNVYNSAIISTNDYYFLWQRLSDGDANLKNTFRIVNSTINNTGGIVLERPVAVYIENSNLTNLVGNHPVQVCFRWPPRELTIKNSVFAGKTGTEKIYIAGGDQFGELSPKPVGIDIIDSDFSQITLECVQDSPYYLSPGYPGCTANIINTKLGPVTYSGTTLRNKYYLDVKVVDSDGNPVSGANVTVTNEQDDLNYPAENLLIGKKYFQLKDQLSPTGDPYFKGQTVNWFKGWADVNDLRTTFTNANGHIPLSSDVANTLIITANETHDDGINFFTYKITASKDGYTTTVYNITADSSWYRSNPNVPTDTITIILNDSILPINHAPVLNSIGDKSTTLGSSL
ncbi:carboxypeptidase regulatory-like domain-containing protein, partial [bacterium]|nr:carboxypeptidase regulatory-like domain-containing protein [bacterium]